MAQEYVLKRLTRLEPNQSFFFLLFIPVKILGLSRWLLHGPNPAGSRLVLGDSGLHLSTQIRGERHRMRPVGENAGHLGGRSASGKSGFHRKPDAQSK